MFIFLEIRLKLLKITSERLQLFQNLFFGGQGLMHPPLKNHGSPPPAATATYLQKRKRLAKLEGKTSHILLSFLDSGNFPCSTVRYGSKMLVTLLFHLVIA